MQNSSVLFHKRLTSSSLCFSLKLITSSFNFSISLDNFLSFSVSVGIEPAAAAVSSVTLFSVFNFLIKVVETGFGAESLKNKLIIVMMKGYIIFISHIKNYHRV